jgi:hypothetical protein
MLATTAVWCTKVLLRVGFEAITSPMDEVNSNSKTGFRSIYFVGEAAAPFPAQPQQREENVVRSDTSQDVGIF